MDDRDWIVRRRLRGLGLRGAGPATFGQTVGHLTAMQAQEHPYARWSVAQRMKRSSTAAEFDRAFDDGLVLRTHVLRTTWHYVAPEDLGWLMALSGPRVDGSNARRYGELGLDPAILNRTNDVLADAVTSGPQSRRELTQRLVASGISVEGQRLSHILMHAELHSIICSGPMKAKQHTYAAFDDRVPSRKGPVGEDAIAELAWRYFSTRGPATPQDFIWWSGLKAAQARAGLDAISERLVCRIIDGRSYWFAESGTPRQTTQVDLVQCYDEMIISYSQSRDLLQTASATFAVPGYREGFQHVLLLDGGLLGHWRSQTDRQGLHIYTRVARALTQNENDALELAIERYRQFAQPILSGA